MLLLFDPDDLKPFDESGRYRQQAFFALHQVLGGRPCIRGLRVRVMDILDALAGGASRADILRDYPYLEDEDIAAALEYAAKHVDHPVIRPA